MLAPAPLPHRLDGYAALADVLEGRVAIRDVDYRLWTSLDDGQQATAIAARRDAERSAGLLESFRDRHGLDLQDRDTVLDLAERMAGAEAEFTYYTDADGASHGSLDTGQQFDISDSRPGAKVSPIPPGQAAAAAGDASRVDRLIRYDRAKVGLADAIRAAGADRWETDVAGSILLDGMAGRVDGCRKVKAYRDACGAWFARPESCHVRTCPDCERSRSARLVRRLDDVAGAMARPAFWTLTVPNVPLGSLGDGIDVLLEAFAALRRLALFRGGQCRGAHDDPEAPDASRRPCRHAPHRAARERAGTCVCARCTVSDARGVPGLDVGPCRARVPGGGRCGRPAEDHGLRGTLAAAAGRSNLAAQADKDHPPIVGGPPDDLYPGPAPLDVDDGPGRAGSARSDPVPDLPIGRGGESGRQSAEHGATIDHPYRAGRRTRGCRRCRHAPVRGGVYAVEVTYAAGRRDWHPHLHALVDAPYILQAEMRDAWRAVTCDAIRRRELRGRRSRRATGTRRPLVDSRAAEGPEARKFAPRLTRCPHRADADGRSIDGCRGASMVWVEAVKGDPGSPERRGAIRETVKYVTKGILGRDGALDSTLGAAGLGELLLALHRRRLVAGWGTLRHVTDDPEDADDGAAGDRLTGPDVLPALRGMPATCPVCRQPADWQLPIVVDRRDCRPLEGGALIWHPPRPGARDGPLLE